MTACIGAAVLWSAAAAQQATVEGKVLTEDGSGVPGAQVHVVPTTAGKARRTAKTKKSGSFELPFLEFGSYRFQAVKEGLLMGHLSVKVLLATKQVEYEWDSDIGPLQEVPEFQIQPGRTAEVTFTMVPKKHFEEGLTIPGDRKATENLEEANRLSLEGEYAKSDELLEAIVASGGATANVYYLLGRNAFASGNLDGATEMLQKCLELNPSQAGANAQLGSIAYQRGDKEAAVEYFRKELETSPGSVPVEINLGLVYSELGRTDDAIASFEKVIELAPKEEAAYVELVKLYMATDRLDKAQNLLSRMESVLTPDPALWFNVGATLSNEDQPEEAAAAYRKALEIDPDFPDAIRELGYIAIREGRTDEAIARFDRYLELRPQGSDVAEIRDIRNALAKQQGGNPE